MRYAWLIVLGLVACKKSKAEDPAPAPVGSGSAVVAAPSPAETAADVKLREEIMTYTLDMVPLLAAWDGDCTKQIERMKKLEPLVQQIREDEPKVAPGFDERIKHYMMEHRAEVVGKMHGALAATKLTEAQIGANDAAIKAKCTGQDYLDELNKIGVMKRKNPNPPTPAPPSPTP